MSIKVVSLFSGGGGLDLGFQAAGYQIIWASDINQEAVDTYRANVGDHITCADITTLPPESIPTADVLIGGPPCQSFSLAGNRRTEDARGRLVWSYLNVLKHVQPQAFVFENVTGLLSAKRADGRKVLDLLCEEFEAAGYKVSAQVMNAADYGVPQLRRRVILVGLRDGRTFKFPAPSHAPEAGGGLKQYVSVREALGNLPSPAESAAPVRPQRRAKQSEYARFVFNTEEISEHEMPQMSELDKYIAAHVSPGGNYRDIPADVPSKRIRRLQQEGGHTTCYGRLHPDAPAHTINTYFNRPNVGCNIHDAEDRLITVREALRLQSFPDSYRLVTRSKKGKQLIVGNAVPPLLAKAVAEQLKFYIK